ncbi:MAG: MG2 domain-containing protein, partial [Candidatus Poribacteria bacterium]|nr:MG2 domain-containing protein [Candidatus Poribacteria bacterium]
VYTDRGIYRPGETANLVSVVRGKGNLIPPSLPVLVQVLAPDNRIFREFRSQTSKEGAFELNVKFPEYAKTGGYIAKVHVADKEIGRRRFQVEEFMPDRIKVTLSTDKPIYGLGDEISLEVDAVNLFGPPAVNRKVLASCDIEASEFTPKKWSSFTFSNAALKFKKRHINLGESRTNEFGKTAYQLSIPSELKPRSALSGVFVATVSEPGGRAVSAYRGVAIHPYTHYVGIRRSPEGYAKLNEEMIIEYISVDKDGIPTSGRNLKLTAYKLRWNSILRRDSGGNYRYVSEKQAEILRSIPLTSEEGVGRFAFASTEYGEYRIEIRDLDSGASTSTEFYTAGWGYMPWAMENPDRLEIDLDKESYQPGEIAKAQIKAPFTGKLILTVEREKVLSYRTVTMKENTAVIDVPILDGYKPNVYLSASLIRSTTSLEKHAPARAFGIVPLKLNDDVNRLSVEIDAAKETRPNRELEVVVRVVSPSAPKREAYQLTVAAVDEGILQLTNFQTPDAHSFFFRQRGLSTDTMDLYSAVLPEVESASGQSSTGGGDGVDAGRKKRLSTVSVMRVKPISLWSGLVTTDETGTGVVRFSVPQFNGTLRLMAVTFVGDRFGKAEEFVTVRDPIVLTPTFPRFVSSGDRFRVPVSVFNGTVEDGDFEVMLDREGAVEILGDSAQWIRLNTGEERQLFFELAAQDAMGKVTFNLSAEGNRESTRMTADVPIRPATPPMTQTGFGVVKAGRDATFTFPSNYIAGTEEFELTLSSFPAVKFAGGISYLLRYPYG